MGELVYKEWLPLSEAEKARQIARRVSARGNYPAFPEMVYWDKRFGAWYYVATQNAVVAEQYEFLCLTPVPTEE